MKKVYLFNELNNENLFRDLKTEYGEEYTDTDIWNEVMFSQHDDFSTLWESINSCLGTNSRFYALLISGDIETWRGKQTYSDIFENFDAFYDFLNGETQYEWEVYAEDNILHIDLHHHDGVNRLVLRGVSRAGYDLYMNYGFVPQHAHCNDCEILELVNSTYSEDMGNLILSKMHI